MKLTYFWPSWASFSFLCCQAVLLFALASGLRPGLVYADTRPVRSDPVSLTDIYQKLDFAYALRYERQAAKALAVQKLVDEYLAQSMTWLQQQGITFTVHPQGQASYLEITAASAAAPGLGPILAQGFTVRLCPIKTWRHKGSGIFIEFVPPVMYLNLGHILNPFLQDHPEFIYWQTILRTMATTQESFILGTIVEISDSDQDNLVFLGDRTVNPNGKGKRHFHLSDLDADTHKALALLKRLAKMSPDPAADEEGPRPSSRTYQTTLIRQHYYNTVIHFASVLKAYNYLRDMMEQPRLIRGFSGQNRDRHRYPQAENVQEYYFYAGLRGKAYYYLWPKFNYLPRENSKQNLHRSMLRMFGQAYYFAAQGLKILWPQEATMANAHILTLPEIRTLQTAFQEVAALKKRLEVLFPTPKEPRDFNRPPFTEYLPPAHDWAEQVLNHAFKAKQAKATARPCPRWLSAAPSLPENKK